jgi:hypothetical protein
MYGHEQTSREGLPQLTGSRLFAVNSEVHGIRMGSARFVDDVPVNAELRIVARCLAGSYGSANCAVAQASVVPARACFDNVCLHSCCSYAGRVPGACAAEID